MRIFKGRKSTDNTAQPIATIENHSHQVKIISCNQQSYHSSISSHTIKNVTTEVNNTHHLPYSNILMLNDDGNNSCNSACDAKKTNNNTIKIVGGYSNNKTNQNNKTNNNVYKTNINKKIIPENNHENNMSAAVPLIGRNGKLYS